MADTELESDLGADGLTPGEKSYLESGGENADALLAEQKTPAPDAAPAAKDTPAVAAPAKDKAAADAPAVAASGAKDAPVGAAGADDDDDAIPTDPKATIPYPKYAREKKKLQDRLAALEKQNGELSEKFTRGDERLRLLNEVMAPQPQQQATDEDPEPDPNEDIIAWANWSRRENGRLREAISQTQGVVQETNADTAMRNNYVADVQAFARETPDFGPAYNHLITVRAQNLATQGYSEAEIKKIIHNEEKSLVQSAMAKGKRPASVIYDMAKQWGWRSSAPAAQVDPAAAAAANGAQAAQAAPAAKAEPSVVDEIERIQRGQAAGKSLSDAGGAPNDLTVEALANMSENEFTALYASKKGQIDGLLGKRH